MNIQLVVNGVDLAGTYRSIGSDLNENSVKRLCAFVKDAFPLCFIHRGDLSTRVTCGGQDLMVAVKTADSYAVFVYNCMAQDTPYMSQMENLSDAWLAVCEHMLQTRLDNLFNPAHVLEINEFRAREYGESGFGK